MIQVDWLLILMGQRCWLDTLRQLLFIRRKLYLLRYLFQSSPLIFREMALVNYGLTVRRSLGRRQMWTDGLYWNSNIDFGVKMDTFISHMYLLLLCSEGYKD